MHFLIHHGWHEFAQPANSNNNCSRRLISSARCRTRAAFASLNSTGFTPPNDDHGIIQGRSINEAELAQVRTMLSEHPGWSRRKVR